MILSVSFRENSDLLAIFLSYFVCARLSTCRYRESRNRDFISSTLKDEKLEFGFIWLHMYHDFFTKSLICPLTVGSIPVLSFNGKISISVALIHFVTGNGGGPAFVELGH